jgi:hypothetical protein
MSRKLFGGLGLALAALVLLAGNTLAAVTFDPETGYGFVGKGDVQLAFGLNNPQIQAILLANPQAFTFTYITTDTYEAVCTWITGEGTRGEQTHNVTHTTSTGLLAAINGSPRSGPTQFTGFNLNGFAGAPVESGDPVPVLGGPCPGNEGTEGTWTSVTQTGSSEALYVTYNGTTVALNWPTV